MRQLVLPRGGALTGKAAILAAHWDNGRLARCRMPFARYFKYVTYRAKKLSLYLKCHNCHMITIF